MKNHFIKALIVLISLVVFISACSSGTSSTSTTPAATSALDGATLVQERCSVCHSLTRVESARHSAAEWTSIVGMMISRGAQLNSSEQTAVIDYLAANFGK